MQAILYQMNSDRIKLNKSLLNPLTIDIVIKNNCDILNPIIELYPFDSFNNYNYLYISEWEMYYFIDTQSVLIGQMISFTANIDPLMTYKTQILGLSGITSRMSGNNFLLADGKMKTLAKMNVIQHNFQDGEMLKSVGSGNWSIILNVIGGSFE